MKKNIVRAIAAICTAAICVCITLAFIGAANVWGWAFCAIMIVMADLGFSVPAILLVKEVTTDMD